MVKKMYAECNKCGKRMYFRKVFTDKLNSKEMFHKCNKKMGIKDFGTWILQNSIIENDDRSR